jgi:type I restriction enzyme M protein
MAEVQAKRLLFDALGFDPTHAFTGRTNAAAYVDFAPTLADRSAIRTLVENNAGVQARTQALRDALAAWWDAHAVRLADLPARRDLNAVRAEFLDSFVAALSPLGVLDRFQLAGVIATWWTATLPDFKTLLENGFPGVH